MVNLVRRLPELIRTIELPGRFAARIKEFNTGRAGHFGAAGVAERREQQYASESGTDGIDNARQHRRFCVVYRRCGRHRVRRGGRGDGSRAFARPLTQKRGQTTFLWKPGTDPDFRPALRRERGGPFGADNPLLRAVSFSPDRIVSAKRLRPAESSPVAAKERPGAWAAGPMEKRIVAPRPRLAPARR